MDKAGIVTEVTQHQKNIDAATADGKEVKLSQFAQKLLAATQEALEQGKSL